MKILKCSFYFLILSLCFSQTKAQGLLSPNKYTFKPMIEVRGDYISYDYGVLKAITDDMIIIQSLEDFNLYGYKLDSIRQLKFKRGPGFMQSALHTEVATTIPFIASDLIYIASAGAYDWSFAIMSPIITIPASILIGTCSAIITKKEEYLESENNYSEFKSRLEKYSINIDTIDYTIRTLRGIDLKSIKDNYYKKKVAIYFSTGYKFNIDNSGYHMRRFIGNLDYRPKDNYYENERYEDWFASISLSFDPKYKIGYTFYTSKYNISKAQVTSINQTGNSFNFAFGHKLGLIHNFFGEYTFKGNNLEKDILQFDAGLGLLITNNRNYYYAAYSNQETNISFNNGIHNGFGLEIKGKLSFEFTRSTSVNFEVYADLYPSKTLKEYTLNIESNDQITFPEKRINLSEFGVKAYLTFHL